MTVASRVDALRAMVTKNPEHALARFGLANELLKSGAAAEAAEHYAAYLSRYDDEGNGWGRYAEALLSLGRIDEAVAALEKGIAASYRFGHGGMASELEARRDEVRDA
jgi:predicted Zn-dependent protease